MGWVGAHWGAECRNGVEQTPAMPAQGDAEIPQVIGRQAQQR